MEDGVKGVSGLNSVEFTVIEERFGARMTKQLPRRQQRRKPSAQKVDLYS
jgi:hypothetical protein